MTAPARNRLIGALHAAAKKQGMDDETRRAFMARITGKSSAKDMTPRELGSVLDEMNKGAGGKRKSLGQSWQRKIRALWISAHQLGMTETASDQALDAFVRRQAGVSALRFVAPDKASSVIEALKDWMARPVAEGGGGVKWKEHAHWDDRNLIALAMWEQLAALGEVKAADFMLMDAYARQVLAIHQCRSLTGAEWGQMLPRLAHRLAQARETHKGDKP